MRLVSAHWPPDPSDAVRDTTVGQVLREAAAATPDATALIEGVAARDQRRRWSYARLLDESPQLVWYGVRAPRDQRLAWDRFWRGVRRTGFMHTLPTGVRGEVDTVPSYFAVVRPKQR